MAQHEFDGNSKLYRVSVSDEVFFSMYSSVASLWLALTLRDSHEMLACMIACIPDMLKSGCAKFKKL